MIEKKHFIIITIILLIIKFRKTNFNQLLRKQRRKIYPYDEKVII